MPITVSKLKDGTLKLGTTPELDVSCQVTNCRITSSYSDDGNTLTTLCGDTAPPARKLDGRQLAGTVVQDFDKQATAGGVIDYLWLHELEDTAFHVHPEPGRRAGHRRHRHPRGTRRQLRRRRRRAADVRLLLDDRRRRHPHLHAVSTP